MKEKNLSKAEQTILEHLPQPLAVYQYRDGIVETLAVSDGFCELFGYSDRKDAYHDLRTKLYKYDHPDDVIRLTNAVIKFAEGDGVLDIVYRSKSRKDGLYHIIHATGKHVDNPGIGSLGYVWYIDGGVYSEAEEDQENALRRILNNALHEESLLRDSKYDRLTGLPSLNYFFQLAEAARRTMKQNNEHPAMLYFDLQGMKFFNSRNGFSEGDRLLLGFSELLAETFGRDRCCHVGADHFAAFALEKDAEVLARKVIERTGSLNQGNSLPVSIGIYPNQLEDVLVSSACDRAKCACDSMKNSYQSGFRVFTMAMRDMNLRRQYLLSHIDQAIEEGWIQVYYQPIVRAVNGRVCDEEALARWIDPVNGFLSPAEFIPFLEDSGLIWKLDLCVLDQVLKKLIMQEKAGLFLVPQSVNLSRSDFNTCDIVEEVRKRVDDAGISRSLITIEITESTLGLSMEFMKEQVERFQKLGFQVWLDDFGSGYSSLDVLQTIRFDLLKFDMSFMRKLDEGEQGKIILTELMRMASALHIETVCEGVEKKEQVDFLKEIGCSKLQGYFYTPPIPLSRILERYEKGIQIGFEDPSESSYYEAVSNVSLYSMMTMSEEDSHHAVFDTLPMAVMEVKDDSVQLIRFNQAFLYFLKRYYHMDSAEPGSLTQAPETMTAIINNIRRCVESDSLTYFDELLEDGTIIHFFARRISRNPITGKTAVALSVISISRSDKSAVYARIARSLAADYYNIYYVDLQNEHYIEYTSPIGQEELALEKHGDSFFRDIIRDADTRIYEEDRAQFLEWFRRDTILSELDQNGVFTATYRLIENGIPMYVNMKINYMLPEKDHIIIGISVVDAQMKQKEESDRIQREESVSARVMALSDDYLSLYTIDLNTNRYLEFQSVKEYEKLGISKMGEDFFTQSLINAESALDPKDLRAFRSHFSKEQILDEIKRKQAFSMHYHLMINGESKPVTLKIVSVQEKDGQKLIAGVRAWKKRK